MRVEGFGGGDAVEFVGAVELKDGMVLELVEVVCSGKERYLDDLCGEHGVGYILNCHGLELEKSGCKG